MDINNLTSVYNQNPTLQGQYTLQQYLDMFGGSSTGTTTPTTNASGTGGTPNYLGNPVPSSNQGIINQNINQYQSGGGGGGPSVVDSTSVSEYRNPSASAYGPGGQLEVNPAAIGMDFTSQGNARSNGPFGISTPPRSMANFAAAGTGPSELGYMTKDISGLPGVNRDMIRGQYDNYNTFLGRNSGYADANVKGTASDLANMIPYVGTFKRGLEFAGKALGLDGPKGPPSDRARYATDNGFAGGQGLGRDEFGVYTGGKTGFGKTADYQERIGNRLGELESFFSKKGIDLNDPNLDIEKMKGINGFYTKQYFAYKNRQATDKINKDFAAKLESDRKAKVQAEKDRLAGLVNTYGYDNNGRLSKIETESGGNTAGTSRPSDHSKSVGLGHNAGAVRSANKAGTGSAQSYNQNLAYGGSVKSYFKGGIVSLRRR